MRRTREAARSRGNNCFTLDALQQVNWIQRFERDPFVKIRVAQIRPLFVRGSRGIAGDRCRRPVEPVRPGIDIVLHEALTPPLRAWWAAHRGVDERAPHTHSLRSRRESRTRRQETAGRSPPQLSRSVSSRTGPTSSSAGNPAPATCRVPEKSGERPVMTCRRSASGLLR